MVDCASYCAVLRQCVGCSEAVEAACNDQCLRNRASTQCFTCALDHIAEVDRRLSCDMYQPDAGSFTLFYRDDSCGAVCDTDAGAP
jgi:hypothetical protein